MQGRRIREIPEKTRRSASSPCTIPTCENPRVTSQGKRTRLAEVGKVV
ncbi:hypothetical protein PR048_029511 [Dryococelus australis]|uniref:Uncharacterized protein n=1 Tax=Dryococelus australis TaxID=614101 RepID=A0ABQ9GDK6_9NEOP|nr:hypothetical protein PR048_029511 [Dryococelus australis]